MKQSAQQKIDQIQELLRQREEINRKLEALVQPDASLPADIAISDEVFTVIKEAQPDAVSRKDIMSKLKQKYPQYGIDKRQVASALAYLKNSKKQIDIAARGTYKLVNKEVQNT